MAGMQATWWLNERLQAWLGEKNAADTLTQSVPHNVTSEMGLALLDVADVIRPHPEVVAFLHDAGDEGFLDELAKRAGGQEARDAIQAYLGRYGMRCVGEIDITRPRWSERPTTLLPMILTNIKNFEPGAGERRFEQGRQEAWAKEQDLLERLRALPDGELKAEETKRMIDRVRTFIGYREYPKYGMVSRYFVYKQALLDEAGRLVRADVLGDKDDIFFLRFAELHDVVQTNQVDDELIRRRKEASSVISGAHATPGAHVGWRGRRRDVPTRRSASRCAGRPAGFCRDRRRAGPSHPGHGRGRSRTGRHPGHGSHRPQLVAPVRRDHGPGDGGRGPDDPRRGDRTGIRPAGRRRGRTRHALDPGWAADPCERNRRVHRDPRYRACWSAITGSAPTHASLIAEILSLRAGNTSAPPQRRAAGSSLPRRNNSYCSGRPGQEAALPWPARNGVPVSSGSGLACTGPRRSRPGTRPAPLSGSKGARQARRGGAGRPSRQGAWAVHTPCSRTCRAW